MISLEISKLDILDMETQMLNRAAQTGKMEDAKRQVRRNKRIRSGELVWEYQGEMWADEVGYYRVNTKSECPASMME
jgi:xanthine dehydrogenase molybdopterin-binding subunit B